MKLKRKCPKSIGMLYKAKFLLNKKCLKDIYYAFIHSYLNYANIISWASTNPNKLNKLYNKRKHAARIIFNEDRMTHASIEAIKYSKYLSTKHLSNVNSYV